MSSEEDDLEDLTMTMEASAEEAEEKTRLSKRIQRRSWRCVYGPRKLKTMTAASAQGLSDDGGCIGRVKVIDNAFKVLETPMEAAGDQRRARGIYGNYGGVGGGR